MNKIAPLSTFPLACNKLKAYFHIIIICITKYLSLECNYFVKLRHVELRYVLTLTKKEDARRQAIEDRSITLLAVRYGCQIQVSQKKHLILPRHGVSTLELTWTLMNSKNPKNSKKHKRNYDILATNIVEFSTYLQFFMKKKHSYCSGWKQQIRCSKKTILESISECWFCYIFSDLHESDFVMIIYMWRES